MRPEQKEEFKRNVGKLFAELKQKLGLKRTPKLFLVDDKNNASNPFGRTAHYDPQNEVVKLFITERHPKDILRSFSHEVIHHWQNENGKLSNTQTARAETADPRYAQNDPELRKMEKHGRKTRCIWSVNSGPGRSALRRTIP